MDDLKQLLSASGHRLTSARQAVFAALLNADKPIPIAAIHKSCAGINRTSVYRVVELFLRLGIATKIPHGWKAGYELAEPFKAHHHHLHCERCGELIALNTPVLESVVHQLANSHGYKLTSHHIELIGVCKSCQNRTTDAKYTLL